VERFQRFARNNLGSDLKILPKVHDGAVEFGLGELRKYPAHYCPSITWLCTHWKGILADRE